MSDGDPSLEEDPASPQSVVIASTVPGLTPPPSLVPVLLAAGVHMPLRPPAPDSPAPEVESFLSDEERNAIALRDLMHYEATDSDRFSQRSERATEEKVADIQAMSVLSMYQENDNMSRDMNTERDNESEASTRPAEESACGEPGATAAAQRAGKPGNGKISGHCTLIMSGQAHNPSLLFNDGVRSVDFVLVWEAHRAEASCAEAVEKRRLFEENLERDGLQLEREAHADMHGLHFVKIHTPLNVLRDYSEILKLRMPMKECSRIQKGSKMNAIMNAAMYMSKFSALKDVPAKTQDCTERIKDAWGRFMAHIRVDNTKFPERKHRLTAIYSKDKEYLFDTTSPCFWTPSSRSRIVQFILDRKRYSDGEHDEFAIGIDRLVSSGIYSAAYPLHDGDLKTPGSMRHLLYTEWASVSKCLKYQPLDYVKDYFGVKIGLYFAWLGFYTHMLLPASLVGLMCFIYSCATLYTNKPSEDVCHDNSTIKMCPLCDDFCDYWDLRETCLHARVTYLFDNATTVFFAIFMSFWAALFLELWKRYSAEMTHRWDLTGFDVYEEHPRPQYLARLAHVKRTQLNVVTGEREPMVPFWRMRFPGAVMSFSVVCVLVLLAMATVIGVVLYRVALLAALSATSRAKGQLVKGEDIVTSNAILFTTATAACINLCFICIFNYIYQYLAEWLTEKEMLRTQTEFDDSLTLKIYLLQFVNYYASIFYIAFFKGKFVGRPGGYVRFFGYRQEECSPGGCLTELCIQLAIIMVGKQAVNTLVEMLLPYLIKWYNIIRTIGRKNKLRSKLQYVKDFKLVNFGHMGLFPEYLEMVLQYGFVTIFVAAFPLAPLFALANNVLEMRLDAVKLLTCYRRPVPQRVNDIGVWFRILDCIGKLSIITNGFIIAFTSEFIPRLVYRLSLSTDGTLEGYLQSTLAEFNTTDLDTQPIHTDYTEQTCRYPGYWQSGASGEYKRTDLYWHVMGARLAFVVVFENVVAVVMMLVRWAIPDMSSELRDRIRREAYVINCFILEETRARSAAERRAARASQPQTPGEEGTMTEGNWNQLLSASLSESDFDLAAHGGSTSQHVPDSARHHERPRRPTAGDIDV